MFESERPLLISVTLDASCIGAGRQSRLFQFKSTVRVVAVTALHQPFQHFVMKRHIELMFSFAVAAHTKLRFTHL
jgi:hypothetical protein